MNRRLAVAILSVAVIGALCMVSVVLLCPPARSVSINRNQDGVVIGIVFWIALAVAGSSLAVRMPNGTEVDVAFGPIVAALSLGGPAVAAWVALLGTFQLRELRGGVPWYGVVANRAGIVLPAMAAGLVSQAIPGRNSPLLDFLATVVAASVCFGLNFLITALFVSIRDGASARTAARAASGAFVSLLALGPVAWLMAQMWTNAGWWAVLLFALPLYTTRIAYSRFVELREMFTETVTSLAEAVDKRDKFTSGHSRKVQEIAVDIGKAMKCSDDELEALEWGGLLHDIGKIGIPDSVLLKTERLTREERTTMNNHPRLGAEIIAPVKRLAPEVPIILHHHEWFNGSGYPDRLVGDDIPRLARILHVADAFEAMTAARPYRMTPLSPAQALAELRKFGGIQFDPAVVDAFVKTRWASGLPDPGKPGVRQVPLIGQPAGSRASGGVPAGSMATANTGGSGVGAADAAAPGATGCLGLERA